MLPYFAGFVAFLYWAARTRKKAPFYLYIAGILCALAILAKGLAGLGLPVIVFLAYLLFTWNWKRLARAQLGYGVLVALLGCAVVAIPWHHAMLARHGLPFWDELYGDNHWRRLVLGRHGDRGAFEYFLRELGYAVLPLDRAGARRRWPGWRTRRFAPRARARRRRGVPSGRRPAAGDLLAGGDLVRVGVRGGVAVDHQVPPLHPAGAARPGAGRSAASSTTCCRCPTGRAPGWPLRRRWSGCRCWRWCCTTWPAPRTAPSCSSGCSPTTTSTRPRAGPGRPGWTSARR